MAFSAILAVPRTMADTEARASYVFRPAQNGVIPDEKEQRHHATIHLDSHDGWIDTEEGPAVELKNPEDRIEIPSGAFPGKRGAVRITFRSDSVADNSQYLFRVYHASGDGLMLYLRDGALTLRYHNRAENTNISATLPASVVKPGEWTTATASWDFEKEWKILIGVDAKRKVGREVKPDMVVSFDAYSQVIVGNEHAGSAPFLGAIHSVQFFDKPLWEPSTTGLKEIPAVVPKVVRERVLPRTLFFSRSQPKYDLFSNPLLRRWIDRPLFFDRRTETNDKPFSVVSSASFLKNQQSVRAYGLDGFGSLLMIPTQGTAFTEMLESSEAHPGKAVPLVMEVAGCATKDGAAHRQELFLALAERAIHSDRVMRVNGRILVLSYAVDSEPLESWIALRDAVRARFGDKFMFIADMTTRRPALLREFQELNGVSARTLEDFRHHLRQWLDASDGIMWAGGSHTNKPDGTLDRAFYREFLVPALSGVLNEKPYRGKLLGLDAEVGYVNMMTSRRINPEEGTRRLRDNFEIALEANPDFVTMPEWDELNENTSIGPTLTNSLSTQRIVSSYIHQFSGKPNTPLPTDNTEIPNLVLSFPPYVKLGDFLNIEVLSLPEEGGVGKVRIELSLKTKGGAVVYTFPQETLAVNRMSDHTFSIPSENLASETVLIPSLKVITADGKVSEWEKGLESIRLLPTWNLNYKVTKMPLRDLLQPKEAMFRLSADQPASGVKVEGRIACDEPIMSVEVVQDSRELYAVDPSEELTPQPGEALIMLNWQSMRNPIPFEGVIEVKHGDLRKFVDWTRPEYKRASYRLTAEPDAEGRKVVKFTTDAGVNSTNARGGFFLIAGAENAVLSMKTNLFQADFPMKEILAAKQVARVFPNGLTVEARRLDLLPQVPHPILEKEVAFSATVYPWRQDTPLQMRVVTESGKIYRSAPVFPYALAKSEMSFPVWSENAKGPVDISVSTSRVPDLEVKMTPQHGAAVPVSGSSYFWGLAGGLPFDMGAFAKRALRNAYPGSASNTAPSWVSENGGTCLKFDGKGNFLYFPEETLPRGSFALEFEIKPTADVPQILCTNRGYRRGALTLTLVDGRLGGQWLDRDDKMTFLQTGLVVPTGEWSRVQVDYDLNRLLFTVNGKSVTISCPGGSAQAISPFIFGGYGDGREFAYFSGYLRELRIKHGSELRNIDKKAQAAKWRHLSLANY